MFHARGFLPNGIVFTFQFPWIETALPSSSLGSAPISCDPLPERGEKTLCCEAIWNIYLTFHGFYISLASLFEIKLLSSTSRLNAKQLPKHTKSVCMFVRAHTHTHTILNLHLYKVKPRTCRAKFLLTKSFQVGQLHFDPDWVMHISECRTRLWNWRHENCCHFFFWSILDLLFLCVWIFIFQLNPTV